MILTNLKYGYFQNYDAGDGSMYDHSTAYLRAKKHYTIFEEGDSYYYDILDENKPYKKDSKYGETLVTIDNELMALMPSCIEENREYTLDEILTFMPRLLLENILKEKNQSKKKGFNL